jgi:hypothetical protein
MEAPLLATANGNIQNSMSRLISIIAKTRLISSLTLAIIMGKALADFL